MQDERETPKDEDAEEVEAHRKQYRSEAEGDEGDDDEVEAHRFQERPMNSPERPMNSPERPMN